MPTLRVPTLYKYYLENQTEITLNGTTVLEVLQDLGQRYPKSQTLIFDSNGAVRRHVNLFINKDNIRSLQGVETPLQNDDVLKILPNLSGG